MFVLIEIATSLKAMTSGETIEKAALVSIFDTLNVPKIVTSLIGADFSQGRCCMVAKLSMISRWYSGCRLILFSLFCLPSSRLYVRPGFYGACCCRCSRSRFSVPRFDHFKACCLVNSRQVTLHPSLKSSTGKLFDQIAKNVGSLPRISTSAVPNCDVGTDIMTMPVKWAECNFRKDTWVTVKTSFNELAANMKKRDWSGQVSTYQSYNVMVNGNVVDPDSSSGQPNCGRLAPGIRFACNSDGSSNDQSFGDFNPCLMASACSSPKRGPLGFVDGCIRIQTQFYQNDSSTSWWVNPSTMKCDGLPFGPANVQQFQGQAFVDALLWVSQQVVDNLANGTLQQN